MVNWSAINPVLISLFKSLAVTQDEDAEPQWEPEWRERRKKQLDSATHKQGLYLKVTNVSGIGEDEARYEEVDVDGDTMLQETTCGNRRFTLQVQSVVLEHKDDLWCMQTLERIRTRLRRRSSINALLAVDVSIIRIGQALDVSYTKDGRKLSVGNLDVIFGCAVNDADPVPQGWIEFVELNSHFKDTSGIELPAPPNVSEDWVPTDPPEPP